MKRFVLFLLILFVAIVACKKSAQQDIGYTGKWVEKTLRLDTIDFEKMNGMAAGNTSFYLGSKPYSDPTINPMYPVNPSSFFNYYSSGDSIYLRNFLSSSTIYNPFYFKFFNSNSLTIGKFYLRNSLPAILEFERLP